MSSISILALAYSPSAAWRPGLFTIRVPIGSFEAANLIASRATSSVTPAISKRTLPGFTTATQWSTALIPPPILVSAALDVTDPEPISPDDPLLTLDNIIITPHIGSASIASRREMCLVAARNLVAGLKGERLEHCANPELYPAKGL